MPIRRTVYWKFGEPISLPFVACLSDEHPEVIDGAPPPEPPQWERSPIENKHTGDRAPPRRGSL